MEKNKKQQKILWVCWEKPATLPTDDAVILSFLKPSVEAELKEQGLTHWISARERVAQIKPRALEIYVDIIAKIGTVLVNGMTLRQSLCNEGAVSSWWFHKVACKDCESEPTFNQIVQILTIVRIANENQCTRLVVCGGRHEVVEVLRSLFSVDARQYRKRSAILFYIFSLLRRIKFAAKFLYELILLKRYVRIPENDVDVLFSGFWDWSVKENFLSGTIEDRYYQAVPEKLRGRGVRIGWVAWFYNNFETNKPKRSLRDVIEPLGRHSELIVAQCFLDWREVWRFVTQFRPFFIFARYARTKAFKDVFKKDGLNFYPLLKMWLYAGFLDGTIPYYELVSLAHKKVAQKYQPQSIVGFLNFFPYARALCAGIKKGHAPCVLYDIQHASYSWEDTIGLLDARYEFDGAPDGYAMPHADYMFAMGEFGRDIFMKSGFPPDQILLTGSSRYDGSSAVDVTIDRDRRLKKNILIAASLNKELELEMVDAVYKAFAGFPDVSLHLRSHPFSEIRSCPEFQRYADRVRCTSGTTLEEDLSRADIVIFSYSTVAEEAFIEGVPVWQWISAGYNASVFRDIRVAPAFFSVEGLVRLYQQFLENPDKFIPTTEQRQLVKRKCFYAGAALPSDNIAEVLAARCGVKAQRTIPEQQVAVGS